MAREYTKFDQFIIDLAKKVHNLGTDTLKVMLVNSPAPHVQNSIRTDLTEISAGSGYSAGGNVVTPEPSGGTGEYGLTLIDTTFTASGGTIGPFRYPVLYNDTVANDPLIAWWDMGESITLNDGESFYVDFSSLIPEIIHVAAAIPAGNPTTGFTITIPYRVQTNDILLLAITNRDAIADPSTPTDDDAGGNVWVKVLSKDNGASNGSVWWKRATASTALKTITVAGCTGSCAGGLSVYRGVSRHSTAPFQNAAGEANISGNEEHASITPTGDYSMICLFVFNPDDLSLSSGVATNPKLLTTRFEKLSTGGNDSACFHASGAQAGAASDTGIIRWSQTNGLSISIAFNLIVFRNYREELAPVIIE